MAKPIKISIIADESDFSSGMSKAEASMEKAEATAKSTGAAMQGSLEGAGEGADTLASKGAQAAGALSGIGQVVGAKFPAVGAALQGAGSAMQFAADSGDLLNVAIEGGQKLWASTVGVLGKVAGALKLQKIASIASAVAQKALNLAMSANPIGLIIAAITILVGLFILAYKKSDTFRAIVNKVGAALKTAAQWIMAHFVPALKAIVKWIGDHVIPFVKKMIQIFGPGQLIAVIKLVISWFKNKLIPAVSKVASAVTAKVKAIKAKIGEIVTKLAQVVQGIRSKVGAIKNEFGEIAGKVGEVVGKVRSKFGQLIDWLRGMPSRIARATRNMFYGILNAFRSAINTMIRGWNRISFRVPSIHIPGIGTIGGIRIGVPSIPFLANGGIVTGPTLAVIGEAGPEAVVPLGRQLGNTYVIKVQADATTSPADIGRGIVRAIREYEGATGGKVLAG